MLSSLYRVICGGSPSPTDGSSLKPDFKTIADFRRDNRPPSGPCSVSRTALPAARPLWTRVAGRGRTRIKAVNNKDRNFTRKSLQDFIRAADERLDEYLRLDEGDIEEGGTGGGTRTKNLAEKIEALRQNAGATGRCWRILNEPAKTRFR